MAGASVGAGLGRLGRRAQAAQPLQVPLPGADRPARLVADDGAAPAAVAGGGGLRVVCAPDDADGPAVEVRPGNQPVEEGQAARLQGPAGGLVGGPAGGLALLGAVPRGGAALAHAEGRSVGAGGAGARVALSAADGGPEVRQGHEVCNGGIGAERLYGCAFQW